MDKDYSDLTLNRENCNSLATVWHVLTEVLLSKCLERMSDIIKTTAKLSRRKIHVATVYAFLCTFIMMMMLVQIHSI